MQKHREMIELCTPFAGVGFRPAVTGFLKEITARLRSEGKTEPSTPFAAVMVAYSLSSQNVTLTGSSSPCMSANGWLSNWTRSSRTQDVRFGLQQGKAMVERQIAEKGRYCTARFCPFVLSAKPERSKVTVRTDFS